MQLVNGKFTSILDLDRSFIFHGYSVFTTLIVLDRIPLNLNDHLNRLKRNAEEIGLSYPGNDVFISDIKLIVAQKNNFRLRLTVGKNCRITTADTYKPISENYYINGVDVIITPYQVHRDLAHLKTGNYLPYLQAFTLAQNKNVFEGMLIDQNKNVVDGSKTSPLLYSQNKLTILMGGLCGITREKVADTAIEMGIKVERKLLKADELTGQLLLTSSTIGLVPVGNPVDDKVQKLIDHFKPINLVKYFV